jgi:hypothetical protein
MEIKGKLVHLLQLQTGQGKNGTWRKQDIIIETPGLYPKKVCISIWGDKINENLLQIGNELNVQFDIESREFNGKWYTDVKAWKIDSASQSVDYPEPVQPTAEMPEPVDDIDDLPF